MPTETTINYAFGGPATLDIYSEEEMATAIGMTVADLRATLDEDFYGPMPEPDADGATDCLMRAGADGLNFSLPAWLQRMNNQRWMVPPSVNAGLLYNLGRALAAERVKRKR